MLALLELLKDDPELYVRRSVANSLNDIAKDHPDLAIATGRRWLEGASAERRWVVQHALRFLVKQGHAGALSLMGAGQKPKIRLATVRIAPARVRLGGAVACTSSVSSASRSPQDLLRLTDLTTRKHYAGRHGIDLLVNGIRFPLGGFRLTCP